MKTAVLALGLMSAASVVAADRLDCQFPNETVNSWIRTRVIVEGNIESGPVTVFDSLLNETYGGPVEGRVATSNAKRVTIRWKARNVQTREGFAPSINYALTVQRASGAASAIELFGSN